MSGEFINRHHEELRLEFYDPDNEAFPIPLRYVDVMGQTQTSITNQCLLLSMIFGPKRRVSIFLRSGLGLQDSSSYVQDFLKDTSGKMKDLRKSKRLTDQTVYGFNHG